MKVSQVVLVKYGKRETETVILSADNMNMYLTDEGGFSIELFDYDAKGKNHKGYRMVFNEDDKRRLKELMNAKR